MSHIIIGNVQEFTASEKNPHFNSNVNNYLHELHDRTQTNVFEEILNWHRLQD